MKRHLAVRPRYWILALMVIVTYFVCPFRLGVVWGRSMAPTFRSGEICLLDRNYYQGHPLGKGEVIVFREGDEVMTKRIYAAPGDRLVLIRYNDGTSELPRGTDPERLRRVFARSRAVRVVTLRIPAEHCFVLGDNRAASRDSRHFGLVPKSAIIGKLVSSLE